MKVSVFASLAIACALLVNGASSSLGQELLDDPGFEDTRPLLPEDPVNSDPWRLTFFTPATVLTDATATPASGVEHASLTKDQSLPNAHPQIDTTVFAGFGPASSITDFTGAELQLSVDYLVTENSIVGPAPDNEPGTFIRMFVAYFGANGFLGFGSFAEADLFIEGTTSDYATHSFLDTVPDFGAPVTNVAYNLAVLGQFGGTGVATVAFDNASLIVIPEPATGLLTAFGVATLGIGRRRR